MQSANAPNPYGVIVFGRFFNSRQVHVPPGERQVHAVLPNGRLIGFSCPLRQVRRMFLYPSPGTEIWVFPPPFPNDCKCSRTLRAQYFQSIFS